MKILSNVEFEKMVKNQTPRLKNLARVRCDEDPQGFIEEADLDKYIQVLAYSGDEKSIRWLKSLKTLTKNGMIERARKGFSTWEDHRIDVNRRFAQKEIPFDIGNSVLLENGKRGIVVDYIPASKEFVVVLNPFEVQQFEAKDLKKVARNTKE